MYHCALGGIKESDQELAHCMFQCVAVASRPLHVDELAEYTGFDFTAQPIPKFHEDQLRKVDEVLSMCSHLLSIVEVNGSSVIQFSNPSVKEYLTSPHLCDASDPLYHVFKTPAHTRAAQACLAIMLHLDNHVTQDNLQDFPLAEYAATHWVDHVKFKYVQQDVTVEEALRCLFDPSKPHLAFSIWVHRPAMPSWRRTERAKRPLQSSETPLHYAALYGLHGIVKYLITERSQNVHLRAFDDESTPLHVVSSRGYVEVARTLLDHGAVVTAQDKQGWTPVHEASSGGHIELVRALLKHDADVMAQNKLGSTPLLLACRRGHVQVSRILLEHGADATAQGKHGWTPLHEASSQGHLELVRTLLEYVAGATAQNKRSTPLLQACRRGHVQVARILLEHGADVTAQDEHGSTPLHKASEGGHADVVFLLLEHDADATAQDKLGLTPLHQASGRGHVEVTRILLEHRVPTSTARDKLGWTPLHGASFGGHVEAVRILHHYGADVTAQDEQGCTPLHHASGRGHAKVAQFLLEKGADVGAKDKQGWTPLHRVFSMGDVDVALVLGNHGADKEARDNCGRTPLDCALPGKFSQPPSISHPETSGAGHRCSMQ